MSSNGLFLGGLLLSEAGFDAAADVLQHAFGAVGIRPVRLEFQILVESLFRAWGRNYFSGLVGAGFGYQVHAFLVIGVRLAGVCSNRFIERGDGLVILAAVGEHCAFVVVVLRGTCRIQLSSLVV